MPVETDAIRSPESTRFADIVQKTPKREHKRRVLKLLHEESRMNKHISLRMKRFGLGHAFHFQDFRQHFLQKPAFIQECESARGIRPGEHFNKFIPDSF